MHELTDTETNQVRGGVIAGPNGEGCTEPRQPERQPGESYLQYYARTLTLQY